MEIGKKTFLSAVVILFLLLMVSGILTAILPMGAYEYVETDGVTTIVPNSFQFIEGERLSVLDWFLAPITVFFTDEGVIVISIILFLMIIGGAIHVLNDVKVLESLIHKVVKRFKDKDHILIYVITFIFMALGAFVGIFEEVIPLVPMMIVLSISLGYDKMMGLGISVLSIGLGFAAAISNPFTLGVAQKLSGIPVFSGALFRVMIFAVTYVLLNMFLRNYGKRIKKAPNEKNTVKDVKSKALNWFMVMMGLLILLIVMTPFVPAVSSYNLPLVAMIFLLSGLGAGMLSNLKLKGTLKSFSKGSLNMLPAVLLIMLATGIKHIIQSGQIMDTLLYYASGWILRSHPFMALIMVYLLVLCLNFFVGSGSAKAFIVMPIIAPLMDMIGVSRQLGVLAFQFGDGFSNILYPTNAVLLIALGLAGVSYTKWFKWIIKLQVLLTVVSILFLGLGYILDY